ncbi:GNAT family N-acetyltransferase [Daejeonella sp.]|uniref:GNAT family N-acetyltransferase n=1 Tax=Daejeonella sp. TaxID=2805397 RepID=UPI0027322034|nr:GNAT family N-acetyltransferase [Daejeonella sp.]MDP2415641.1 GNAT family N-acetyltransferase [Daejeonella sp.]
MIKYRTMTAVDIPDGIKLCRKAKWNQLEADWQIFLQHSPGACMVATFQDQIVGTVTTIRYGYSFSWIGMVLVDPDFRRQGIGQKLLQQALQILQTEETVKLDATTQGREVYLKLNFVDEYRLSRMNMIVVENLFNPTTARPILKEDLPNLIEFDSNIFGANRSTLLQWMWEKAPQLSFLIEDGNEIKGYSMGRYGHDFIHIGPIIAENTSIAKHLVIAALSKCAGSPVILDVLHFESGWIAWLREIGFTEQRNFIRMFRGTNRFKGVPENQFAIIGPEFG